MNTKPFLVVFIVTLAVTIVTAIVGNVLEANGTLGTLGPRAIVTVKIVFFLLFCVLTFSLIPLLIHFFIIKQISIGNAELPIIKWLHLHEKGVVYVFWVFCLVGLSMAVPAAIKNGFFR